jgi:hypothetical protein
MMLSDTIRTALVACSLVLLAACAATPPPQPVSMRDPGANFGNYKTFGWYQGSSSADQPVRLLDQNIRAAITDEMQRRGYTLTDTNPDLRLAYETSSQDKIENNPVRVGVGVGSWGGNFGGSVSMGSPSIRNYKEGSLLIHAIDGARNSEVWQGGISSRLTHGSLEAAAIRQAVGTAMRDFPRRSTGQ